MKRAAPKPAPKPDPVDLADEFLAQLHCTTWGRGFDLIHPDTRRKAAEWFAGQMKSFTEWGSENGKF